MTCTIPKQNGLFPRKQYIHFNPGLAYRYAYMHSLVQGHWEYMMYSWKPSSDLLLLTPCSNVKPYPKSPVNAKIKCVLRRLGLWNYEKDQPFKLDHVYISDLLGPVPYNYTWTEPACCYDAPPTMLENNTRLKNMVIKVIEQWWNRVHGYYNNVIYCLPRKYYSLTEMIREHHGNPKIHIVKYDIFYVQREIENVLKQILAQTIRSNID